MKRMTIVVVGLALAGVSLPAQELSTPSGSPTVQQQQRRFQFQLMESVLKNAIRQGAQEVSMRAEGVMPIGVMFFGMPKARGFPLEPFGVVFDVEIPQLRPSLVVLNQFPQPNATPRQPPTASQTVANGSAGGTTRATGVVPDDPMARSPVTSDPFVADPHQFYRDVITVKLVDAMLDFSKSLEIRDEEWLSVVARGEEDPMPTSLYSDSVTLILKIKGSDLALFYSDKISREEVRKRVIHSQF
jgi:hypothetical protein